MIDIPKYDTCFVCGRENAMGLNLSFKGEGERAFADFSPQPGWCGYRGIVHGGIISSILDECMGWAAYATTELFFFTIDIKVSFIKPVILNREYRVVARILERDGKTFKATGKIIGKTSNRIFAQGEGNYYLRTPKTKP